ncbi:MAG: mannitol dehydrogenase family protein [Alphaproteobacteria bacterium]
MSDKPKVHVTSYDRAACQIGFVHLGFGAFHRAHQAVFVDDYMENTGDLSWGIAAVNLRASEADTFTRAASVPDGYLLKTTSPAGDVDLRMVRPHLEFADWSSAPDEAENLLTRPSVQAVTITVTESGYYLEDGGSLNADDPIIAAEVADGLQVSVYAYLARALERRAGAIDQPITILCCDNVRSNGHMLEQNFLTYLGLTGRTELAQWVRARAAFPCSMVDRITPRATETLAAEMTSLFPGQNLNPIHAETFIQWVLGDQFAGPMPDLTRAGVEIVADVDPYEEAKIRILNGGHTGLTYLAALAGHHTFDAAMRDPAMLLHFDNWERNEVLPALTIDLPLDKTAYLDVVAARFGNRAIADSLERICMDGYSKMQIFIRPTLQGCLEQGIMPRHGFDCVASWYVYARRSAAGSMPIAYHEPNWASLEPLLAPGAEADFARSRQLWADLPQRFEEFAPALIAAIEKMEKSWPA